MRCCVRPPLPRAVTMRRPCWSSWSLSWAALTRVSWPSWTEHWASTRLFKLVLLEKHSFSYLLQEQCAWRLTGFTVSPTAWMPWTRHPDLSSVSTSNTCTHGPQAAQLPLTVPHLTLTVSCWDGHSTRHEFRGPTDGVSRQCGHDGAARHESSSWCAQPAAATSQPAETPAPTTFARPTAGRASASTSLCNDKMWMHNFSIPFWIFLRYVMDPVNAFDFILSNNMLWN